MAVAPSLRTAAWLVSLAALAGLQGCAALYFLGGKGSQPALYTLPKTARILVFVDPRANVTVPVDFPSALGEKIANHLYKYGVADKFVAQERLTALRRDQQQFSRMGIADVAKATDADVVIYVDLISFQAQAISDDSMAEGSAHVLVKVLGKDGARLWPKDSPTGIETAAQVEPALTSDRSVPAIITTLSDMLSIRVGRMFQSYDKEDSVLSR